MMRCPMSPAGAAYARLLASGVPGFAGLNRMAKGLSSGRGAFAWGRDQGASANAHTRGL